MTCEQFSSLILESSEGRLDAARQDDVRAHLASCRSCREAADAQRAVSAVLRDRPVADVSPGFAAKVTARLEQERGWFGLADWRWLTVRVAPVAAALLLAAGVVMERGAVTASAERDTVSLAQVVQGWAYGDAQTTPAAAALWSQDFSQDSALLAVLAAPPDATIEGQSNER